MSLHTFAGRTPRLAPDAFVAPGAQVIGDVDIGAGSSIWYNCVLRGDLNRIVMGVGSNLQDGTIVHVDSGRGDPGGDGLPTLIGDGVLVGHLCIIHGATLLDRAFVGMGSIVMDRCIVEPGAMLAAGSLLTPGKRVPAGELWGGRPARFMRVLSADELARNAGAAPGYAALARAHRASFSLASALEG